MTCSERHHKNNSQIAWVCGSVEARTNVTHVVADVISEHRGTASGGRDQAWEAMQTQAMTHSEHHPDKKVHTHRSAWKWLSFFPLLHIHTYLYSRKACDDDILLPLCPNSAKICPSYMVRSTPSTAFLMPSGVSNSFRRPRIVTHRPAGNAVMNVNPLHAFGDTTR